MGKGVCIARHLVTYLPIRMGFNFVWAITTSRSWVLGSGHHGAFPCLVTEIRKVSVP